MRSKLWNVVTALYWFVHKIWILFPFLTLLLIFPKDKDLNEIKDKIWIRQWKGKIVNWEGKWIIKENDREDNREKWSLSGRKWTENLKK